MLGKTVHEIFPSEQADEFLGYIRRTLETRRTVNFEYSLQIESRRMWFDGTMSPMLEDKIVWVARDITERVRAQELLEERVTALSHVAASLTFERPTEDTLDSLAQSAVKIGRAHV